MGTFLHGPEVIEAAGGPRPVGPASPSVIGLAGTSDAVPPGDLFLAAGLRAARERYAGEGTILAAVEAVHAQGAAPPVAIVNAYDPAAHRSDAEKEQHAWGAAGDVIQLGAASVSMVEIFTAADESGGAVADADFTVDAEAGTITVDSVANVNAGDAIWVDYSYPDIAAVPASAVVAAAERLLDAQSELGAQPDILIAPGFSSHATRAVNNSIEAAPAATGLAAIADRLRAMAVVDGPATTRADALAFRDAIDSRRVILVDPAVRFLGADGELADAPASSRAAGLIARSDRDPARGFWHSPSNQQLLGIAGTSRPVSFALGDPDSEANALNEAGVSTIVRINGWRLWGGRTCSSDPKWQFASVVRTADRIHRRLLEAHLWAVDRNITATYVRDVTEGVNAYLRELEALGAILGGTCWADPELNDAASIAAGRVWFDFDFTPAYPAERITFRSHIVEDYVETVFA